MVPDTLQINMCVRIVNKRKEGGQEIAGLVGPLCRFPGFDNFMVCTVKNPKLPMSTITAGPLWGPLPAIGSGGREEEKEYLGYGPGGWGFIPPPLFLYCFSLVRNDTADSVLSRQFTCHRIC